jgi:hypothetical protein
VLLMSRNGWKAFFISVAVYLVLLLIGVAFVEAVIFATIVQITGAIGFEIHDRESKANGETSLADEESDI